MKGRKPVPDRVKLLTGARRHNRNEPQYAPLLGEAPEWLPDFAKELWRRVVAETQGQRVITAVDAEILAAYCAAYARLRAAEREIAVDGITIRTDNGGIAKHPAVTVANEAASQLRSLGSELGLSPAARARLHAPKDAGKDDFDDWLSKPPGVVIAG